MKLRVISGAALASAVLCLVSPAHAEKETILLDFRGGASCPDRAEFVRRVQAITAKAEVAPDEEVGHRRFGIHVTRAPGGVKGELEIDDQGAKTARRVTGKTCDEVISALALATALAIDPDALSATPSPPTPEVLLLEESPIETVPPPKPHPKPPPRVVPPPPKPRPPPPHRPLLDLSVGTRLGNALAPFPKLEGFVQLGTSYLAPLELYAGFAYGPSQHDEQAGFRDIAGWAGTGYRLLDLKPVSVWTEAAIELGSVEARGLNIEPSRKVQRLWAAVDVGLSAQVEMTKWLFFRANASGRAPLTRQRYVVQETNGQIRELHQVQQLGYLLGLSVGMHFL